MIVAYAAKAVAVSVSSPLREVRTSVSGTRPKPKTRSGGLVKSSFSSSLSNLQKEARRAFSWGPRNGGEKVAPKDNQRKRKNSGLSPPEKNAWEAMTGIQEDSIASFSVDGQDRLPPVSIADEWMLTGDPIKDEAVRSSHRYQTAPDITLFKVCCLNYLSISRFIEEVLGILSAPILLKARRHLPWYSNLTNLNKLAVSPD